jgi:hypothetical protein
MSDERFLTDEDYEYLRRKQIPFTEARVAGTKTVIFPGWALRPGKFVTPVNGSCNQPINVTNVLIIIPDRYNDAGLDSFYTADRLLVASTSADPRNTAFPHPIGLEKFQFWSRHLQTHKWQPGIDGLETFLPLIKQDLETA